MGDIFRLKGMFYNRPLHYQAGSVAAWHARQFHCLFQVARVKRGGIPRSSRRGLSWYTGE